MAGFQLEIVTPDKEIFSGEVESVTVPGTQGSFQVLVKHAPIIATLGRGNVKYKPVDEDEETVLKAQDGVIEVLNNKAIILLERILQ